MKLHWAELRSSGDLIALIGAMGLVSTLGFVSIFGTWSFLAYAAAGAIFAVLVAVAGRVIGLSGWETLVVSLLAFVVIGVVVTQGSLSPRAFGSFVDGLVSGWARALSSLVPVSLTPELRVLPFATAWVGTAIGIELLRVDTPGVAVVGPMAGLIATMLMAYQQPVVAIGQGVALASGALLLVFLQQRRRVTRFGADQATLTGIPRLRGLASAVVMLSIVGVGAWFVGPLIHRPGTEDRFDLRAYQHPPFDPLEDPSPLTQVKAALQEQNADRVVFIVDSDRSLSRFPLAVLDTYNNQVWSVADPASDAPARFRPADSNFPAPEDGSTDGWEQASATIEIVDLDQLSGGDFDPVWLPTLGWPVSITSTSGEALDLRFNPGNGTVALAPEGPTPGLTYQVVSAVPPDLERTNLSAAGVTGVEPFDLAVPQLRDFASNILEGADDGWEQVEAIRLALVEQGAYDSREGSPAGRPGHSLGRLAEFVSQPDHLVGFEEQYAATAALVARSEGIPARVVVGFRIPEDEMAQRWQGGRAEIVAGDIDAWIEVRFDGIGWFPFEMTPARDRQPEDLPQGASEREVALPNPPTPPPPSLDPPRVSPDQELEEEAAPDTDEDAEGSGWPTAVIAVAAIGIVPVAVVAMLALTVLLAKRRRRNRRRNHPEPSRQVAGAWYETVDHFAERGAEQPRWATPTEYARGLVAAGMVPSDEQSALLSLARESTVAAFHPEPATPEKARWAWEVSDRVVSKVRNDPSRVVRIKRAINPRPLLERDPVLANGAKDD